MSRPRPSTLLILALALAGLARAGALAWASPNADPPGASQAAFTYQGRLMDGTQPASGSYAMTFRLYDAAAGGAQAAGAVTLGGVAVQGGLFTVQLDFGPGAFAGGPRWLEVEVGGTILAPRQPLTAAPVALYAPQAGQATSAQTATLALSAQSAPWSGLSGVPADLADGDQVGLSSVGWTDVLSRPAGLDDGDDDTTYSAGAGLALNGTQFSVNAGAMQARVAGSCAVGSSIRAIAADGAVSCAAAEPRPKFTSSHTVQPDDAGGFLPLDVAGSHSINTIDAEGLPVIAYRYEDSAFGSNGPTTSFQLRFVRCNDPQCSSASSTTIDGGGAVGEDIGLIIGYDGLPIISYHDAAAQDLKVAHCENLACTAQTITALESARQTGRYNAITVGGDGQPIISYYDQTDTSLKLARCGNLSCTSAVTATLHDLNDTGKFTSIALGVDGLPVVSYFNETDTSLWLARCANSVCGAVNTFQIDNSGVSGSGTALAIGADGVPVIAYYDNTLTALKVARCNDIACSGAPTVTTVDNSGATGQDPSIAIGSDGLPIVAYHDASQQDLRVAHCQNPACSGSVLITVDGAGNTGLTPSITIGSDGLPLISYQYRAAKLLKTIHCGNLFCTPFARAR
ncbi:MAG TPA: hypothetical protein VD886_10100 [Herpetosiphonaceae bacterium]|nr:hypothetical protein [Herpetosiphonaceae bacterium]